MNKISGYEVIVGHPPFPHFPEKSLLNFSLRMHNIQYLQ